MGTRLLIVVKIYRSPAKTNASWSERARDWNIFMCSMNNKRCGHRLNLSKKSCSNYSFSRKTLHEQWQLSRKSCCCERGLIKWKPWLEFLLVKNEFNLQSYASKKTQLFDALETWNSLLRRGYRRWNLWARYTLAKKIEVMREQPGEPAQSISFLAPALTLHSGLILTSYRSKPITLPITEPLWRREDLEHDSRCERHSFCFKMF